MGFGAKDAKKSFAQAAQASKPKDIYGPTARTQYDGAGNAFMYNNFTDPLAGQIYQGNDKLQSLLAGIPTDYSPDAYFNNPFAKALNEQTARDYETANTRLSDELNARGQTGGSYDALNRKNLNSNLLSALTQNRLQGASAYGDSLNQRLAALAGVRNDGGAALQQIYFPFQALQGQQSVMSPLQAQQAGVYQNQAQDARNNSLFSNYNRYIQTNAQAIGAAAGAGG
jgi:hypothetical protein